MAYTKNTKDLIKAYRAIVARQQALPEEIQWTMGPAVKEAQAKAMVAMEYDKAGIH